MNYWLHNDLYWTFSSFWDKLEETSFYSKSLNMFLWNFNEFQENTVIITKTWNRKDKKEIYKHFPKSTYISKIWIHLYTSAKSVDKILYFVVQTRSYHSCWTSVVTHDNSSIQLTKLLCHPDRNTGP